MTVSFSWPCCCVLVGGIVAYQTDGPARGSGVHDQGSADHHAIPRGQRRRGRPGGHQPDRKRRASSSASSTASSRSPRAGMSVVTAVIKDRYHKDAIPQVWDELRRKIDDVQPQLPPSVRGRSMVVDDFGDVFGIFLAITGDGYSFPELRRYAEFLRRELLLVPNVKKRRALRRPAGSRLPRNLAATAGAARHQRGANLQPSCRRGTSPPTAGACASAISTSRSIRKAVSARPMTCSSW